jgi:hypothetical protein
VVLVVTGVVSSVVTGEACTVDVVVVTIPVATIAAEHDPMRNNTATIDAPPMRLALRHPGIPVGGETGGPNGDVTGGPNGGDTGGPVGPGGYAFGYWVGSGNGVGSWYVMTGFPLSAFEVGAGCLLSLSAVCALR